MLSRSTYWDGPFFLAVAITMSALSILNTLEVYPSDKFVFFCLTTFLLLYLTWEVRRLFRDEPRHAWLAPPVLASISFFITFGIGNFFYLGPTEFVLHDGTLGDQPFHWMNMAMLGVLLGAFAMWRGYHFRRGVKIAENFQTALVGKGILRRSFSLRWPVLWALIGISIIARIVMISKGVYGYTSNPEALSNWAPYKQIVDFGAQSGTLALIGLALAWYSKARGSGAGTRLVFIMVLMLEIIFGFLSGFKGEVVFPIIITGMCYYIVANRLPVLWMLVVIPMLFAAYQVVEPLRYVHNHDQALQTSNVASLSDVVLDIAEGGNFGQPEVQFSFSYLMQKLNLTELSAQAMAYKDEVGLAPGDPSFLQNILLSPLYAYIPRLIWPSKPKSNLGWWFAVKVMGQPVTTTNSIGMSPVGYLYFAGGWLAIFLGFFAIGMLQRIIYGTFASIGGGWPVFFALLWPLGVISSDVGGDFGTVFRYVPVMLLAQYILFRDPAPVENKSCGHKT